MHRSLSLAERSDKPAYRQIVDQIVERVASGDWVSGTEIPSIRGLASDLGVSVITVRRAYLDLERDGVIVTRQGSASCVAEGGSDRCALLYEEELRLHLRQAVDRAQLLGWSDDRLHDALTKVLRKHTRRTA